MTQRHEETSPAAPTTGPKDPRRLAPPNHGMYFATGIENSNPTIDNGRIRIDEMDSCGHYKHWSVDFDLVQELGIERVAELPDHLGRRSAGDGRDVAKGNGIAQNSRDLQQFQRCRGQVAKPPNHKVTQRGRQLRGRHVDDVPGAAQQSFIGQ